ncbi:hypothetical protein NC652_021491 [Populus alba x Populus x berolinensis]|nr:hypothetical protein NC652_021453 [Populus alba x Populus x berolinensis]KAJ6910853.1 hypothetical protein NC652_021491 [Populus alba x Populus x berolinensis]
MENYIESYMDIGWIILTRQNLWRRVLENKGQTSISKILTKQDTSQAELDSDNKKDFWMHKEATQLN